MIQLKELTFSYKKNKPLFSSLNLRLEKGSICGLLGKNGAGKSTFLKILVGLIFPDEGNCEVLDHIPAKRSVSFLNEIYYLPEEIYLPDLTPEQYVNFYAPFYSHFDQTKLSACLAEFELPRQQSLTNFSYGQKKKFLISFGIATGCPLLILDEPTNGLDIPSKTQFRKLIASAIDEEKLFIISTHQVHDVENLIDALVVLDQGKIIFQSQLAEISKHIAFFHQTNIPDDKDCIYFEKDISGYTLIQKNKLDEETHINLEVLFNAITLQNAKLKQLLGVKE